MDHRQPSLGTLVPRTPTVAGGCCSRKWRRHEGLCWGTDAAGGKVAMRRSSEESWEGAEGTARMRVCGVDDGWSDYCNRGEAGDVTAD